MKKFLSLASVLLLLNGCAVIAGIPLPIRIASNVHTAFTVIKDMDDEPDNDSWIMVSLREGLFKDRPFEYSFPTDSDEDPVYFTSKPYRIDDPGWIYLAQGNFQAAIRVFAKDIQLFPDAGIPKVGFALASAATGKQMEGMLAMREAFNIDPDFIHYFYFDEKVHPIIDDLIKGYEYEFRQGYKRPDEAFMVSALHYLKHDYGNAHEAINQAIAGGDKSPGLEKLHRLVDEQFSNDYAMNTIERSQVSNPDEQTLLRMNLCLQF